MLGKPILKTPVIIWLSCWKTEEKKERCADADAQSGQSLISVEEGKGRLDLISQHKRKREKEKAFPK